jgi:hypothetical protein
VKRYLRTGQTTGGGGKQPGITSGWPGSHCERQKTRALDQAAPLTGWLLPECFAQLRRLLEARLNKHGSREYVQVLRLMETFALTEVTHAVEDALLLGTIILAGQQNDSLSRPILVFTPCRLTALRAAWLVHQSARSPLTRALLTGMIYRNASSLREPLIRS